VGSVGHSSDDVEAGPLPPFYRRHLKLLVALPLLVAFCGGWTLWYLLAKKAEKFSLNLELKTPQGSRNFRVTHDTIIIEEVERRAAVVTTNCGLELLDYRALAKLVETTLSTPPVGKTNAGTFTVSLGDDDGTLDNSGDLDAAQAETLSGFILKHATGCFGR
jgi:hypothetical protein